MNNFKNKTVYQIYTKSFMDANRDGIGDIAGVTEKLDYLKFLGIDLLWLTPFFPSPMRDNGYDVADYCAVDECFGTMEELERLIAEADSRDIGLVFDMVFNHTSTAHEWFQKALGGNQEYMDYYIFKDGNPQTPPTNWESKFGGSAWEYVPKLQKWYLHLFDVTQADLNWENPKVREELKQVIRFWKEKGIKGFRFDVVNLISKPFHYEDDSMGDGRRFYTDGPHIHAYLKELVADTGIEDLVTVGEMSSTSLDSCVHYSSPAEKELSMCFNFHHLKVDYRNGNKWELMEPDFMELKNLFFTWQEGMAEQNGWNAVFWCNHDQPRIVSRMGDDTAYWQQSAKMLATCIHMLRGTPYVYQGEEIGMTNAGYQSIDSYVDVESLNYYEIMRGEGKTAEEALNILRARSRDNGRTPMQWSAGKNAGFTQGTPWLSLPENAGRIHVEAQQEDRDSILWYYKRLIELRKEYPVIACGTIEFLYRDHPNLFAYLRKDHRHELLVLNNFHAGEVVITEEIFEDGYRKLLGNYSDMPKQRVGGTDGGLILRPYESIVFLKQSL